MYMFFGAGNPNMRSILKPEVELMVFLRMRNNKINEKRRKMPLKMQFQGPNFPCVHVFGHEKPEFEVRLKPEVELMVFSAHAQ